MKSQSVFQCDAWQVDEVSVQNETLVVTGHTTTREGQCPKCGSASRSVHSYHHRTLQDLPHGAYPTRLVLRTKRLRCLNLQCAKQTFVETVPNVLTPYARRTPRATNALWHIAQVAAGRAGARLATHLRLPTSRMTALRVLRRQPVSISFLPTVIGIDDWAKRRGQSYGTIIVDLEHHRVIDLLPDREPATVAAWLRERPSIRIIARDRSAQYAQGIQAGNPQVIQIADRWHLLKNLSEAVERTLRDTLPKLRAQVSQTSQKPPKRAVFPRSKADMQRKRMTREQRLRRYELVKRLQQRGCSTRQIARLSGLSRGTVLRYCQADTFPERPSKLRSSMLDPYIPYLEQRVTEGCNNAQQLWRELRARGYPGSARQVSKWMQQHRPEKTDTKPTALDKLNDINAIALPGLRTCCYLITADPERLKPSDQARLEQLRKVEVLDQLYTLVQNFQRMVKQRRVHELNPWLQDCLNSQMIALQRFAASLKQDYRAVRAALTYAWSNGQTEGQVNRLKALKRQMYGRAQLDLLRLRTMYQP